MNDETTNLIEKAETIATMIEDRMWPALDVNDSNTLRQIAAALEAAERERERMRAEIVKAWKHTTPAGGSFRQWYDEIQAILSAALAPQPENPK